MSQASPQHLAREWSWNEVEKCWELMKNCQIDGDEGNDEVGEKCEGEKEIALQCNEGPSLQTSSQHLVRESRIDAVEEKGGNEMKSIESSMKRWTWNEVEKCWELMKKCPIDGDEGNDEVDEECDDDESEVEDLNEDDEYVGNNEKLLMYDQVEDDEDSENGVDQLIGLGNQSNIHSAEAHGTQRPDTQQQTLQQHQQINLDQFNDNPEQFNPNSTQSTLSNQTKSNPFPCQPFISSLDQFCASLNHSSYSLNQFNIKSKFIMKPINLYIISSTLPTQSNLEDMDGDDQHGVKQLNRLEHRENHEGADAHGDQLARNMPCGQAVVPDKSPTYLHAYKHVCDHCGIRFNNLYNLKRHIRTHTGERPFHCTWIECNKSFTQNENMLRHLKSHREALRERAQLMTDYQKEYADEEHYHNDKTIRDGSDLTVMNGQMSNVGENDEVREGYDDDETDVEDMDGDVQHGDDQLNELEHLENIEGAAAQGDLLAQIMKSGHAAVPDKSPTYNVHVCDLCGIRFFDLYNLKRHIRTHTGERPYQCTWAHCGKEYTQNHHLKNHIRTHTEEKPFKCLWESCKKAFSKRSYMLSHLKMHTGEFSHVCPHCGKGCILPYHLKVHIRKHTGERPYKCPHKNCGMAFAVKVTMERHFTKYHTQNEI